LLVGLAVFVVAFTVLYGAAWFSPRQGRLLAVAPLLAAMWVIGLLAGATGCEGLEARCMRVWQREMDWVERGSRGSRDH
jgi:hypothetical protein